jgi:hypothetical protein
MSILPLSCVKRCEESQIISFTLVSQFTLFWMTDWNVLRLLFVTLHCYIFKQLTEFLVELALVASLNEQPSQVQSPSETIGKDILGNK